MGPYIVEYQGKYPARDDCEHMLRVPKLSLSSSSPEQLIRTADWAAKLRRGVERFNRVYRLRGEENHEATLAIIEALDYTIQILGESIRYLRGTPSSKLHCDSC